MRDGILIEKGAVLTEAYVLKHRKILEKVIDFWIRYPDIFLDTIEPKVPKFKLFFYQRFLLRVMMRYRIVSGTFVRAFSKSFIAILTLILKCIFLPGSNVFISSDVKATAIDIVRQKLEEILHAWPLLESEIATIHKGNDYVDAIFKNGSTLRIVTMSTNARGLRMTGGVVEEAAKVDGDVLNEVLIPMMNVDRRMENGLVNPNEPHAFQLFITSAGTKTCFMYEKLIEILINSVLEPDDYFVVGGDYRVPVMHGLIGAKQIEQQKNSPTYSQQSFMRESMSIWTGDNELSWFSGERLSRHRTLLRCERKAPAKQQNPAAFYIIGVDVARNAANTVYTVVKALPPESAGDWKKSVVNMVVLHNKPFDEQAIELKKLIEAFDPKEVIIDTNTIGTGLVDCMLKPSKDETTGITYGPQYVINDETYTSRQPRGCHAVIYSMKPTAALNSQMYSNLYSQLNGGHVKFLAPERVVKQKLMATKKGQRMKPEKRIEFLLPHEMISRLMDELVNLKLKNNGSVSNIEVERISRRIEKDRVSSLTYALWKIKEYEDKATKKRVRKGNMDDAFGLYTEHKAPGHSTTNIRKSRYSRKGR